MNTWCWKPILELAILQRTGDAHSIKLVLDVRQEWLEEAPSPLALVGITLEAVFSADKLLSVEQVNQSLPLMGVVNLYGQARAIVAQFTALTPAGPYWLPLVDMQAWFEKWLAAQAAKLGEAEATKSKAKKKGKE